MANPTNHRRGVATLELILVLPLLVLVFVAGIQFASVIVVDTTLSHASIEASRLAAIGCDPPDIAFRVDQFLAMHGMALGGGSRLVIEDEAGLVESLGDVSLSGDVVGTPVAADTVRCTLLVKTAVSPIPNLLRDYGVDFSGQLFQHVAVANVPRCECP